MDDSVNITCRPGVALAGLGREKSQRQLIQWSSQAGFHGIALDATAPGTRGRELDRSARRELAALLRRSELHFTGLDLWIPSSHFSLDEYLDRAVSVTIDAIDLTAEIGRLNAAARPVVSMTLPADGATLAVDRILEAASATGVTIADHQWPPAAQSDDVAHSLGVGIDPATLLLAGDDPVEQLLLHHRRLACVRLSDADQAGRVAPGVGRLDVQAYTAAAEAGGFAQWILIDARGVADPLAAAIAAKNHMIGAC